MKRLLAVAVLPLLLGAGDGAWSAVRQAPHHQAILATIPRAAARAHFNGSAYQAPKLGLPVAGGVFVTLIDERGERPITRACWGSLRPDGSDLADVVADLAQAVLSQDWRQPAVREAELEHLRFVISLLGPLQPVPPGGTLRPKAEGLYLSDGQRGAVLLPGEALTAAWQEAACRRKAGIPAGAPVYRYRFHTLTIEEPHR